MTPVLARIFRWAMLFTAVLAAPVYGQMAEHVPTLTYHVQVTDRSADRFQVRFHVEDLAPEHAILQFASTAPGTYQVMDIGRFVHDLHATDSAGREVSVERVSTNQWRISDPTRVREIAYTVSETWDTSVEEHPIYPMAGTSMEADHVLFNAHAVVPFLQGLQDAPVRLDFGAPRDWTVGTALETNAEGFYVAESYDHLVDSPILAGPTLTVGETEVAGADIEIFVYAKTGGIRADMLLDSMEDMLEGAGEFLGELPVDRYVFLYHFEDPPQQKAYGAWEHSYSSEYVMPEAPWSEGYGQALTDIAAHEFLHIVTPLNIHSEIIEHFNFETPVPSRHLWLYEGVTEWGSHASQMKGGLKSPEAVLEETAQKIAADRTQFDPTYPLEKLALTSYTDEGQQQYGNIYARGAVVAGLLDILLLELSDGEEGLEDLLVELMDRYGKDEPFPDDSLHAIVTEMTDPAVGDFLRRYVVAAEPLPIAEYYAELGIDFIDDETGPRFVIRDDPTPEQARLRAAWMDQPRPTT
jgi:predicted metalloprotease with PDZ domain